MSTVGILSPGLYEDLPEDVYHADPVPETSLSYSGAKQLLISPAHYRWTREHRVEKKVFDYGKAAHAKVLGAGADVVSIPAEILASNGAVSTNAAKEFVAEARAEGKTALKPDEVAVIDAMAAKLLEHPVARTLLDPDRGRAEVSAFWRDPETRIMLRSRFDWLTTLRSGRPCIVDYKSTGQSADPRRWGREAGNLGYFIQDPWYREGYDLLHPGAEAAFLFVVQEKEAPFHVSVCELDDTSRSAGAEEGALARAIYLECMTSGLWPSYPPVVHPVSIPSYLKRGVSA